MTGRLLFLTGGTGFIGRRLLARIAEERSYRLRTLTRRVDRSNRAHDRLEVVAGDLLEPATYAKALGGIDTVLHLAATTGRAAPRDYFEVNVRGTGALLDACARAGVRRIVYVSSIAATYPDKTAYYYAQSKQMAEEVVRKSGLNYLIVRPTIVLGSDSPVWRSLRTLAGLPVMPLFGDGSARVQPIDVDDVVTLLTSMMGMTRLPDAAVDLGGRDVVTFLALLKRIRRRLRGRDSGIVQVPVNQIIGLLAGAERWARPFLPVTAGQLSAFVNDSVAGHDTLVTNNVPGMRGIDEMLDRLISRA
jgi:nucleoside-diphosphate-sugar epimerase